MAVAPADETVRRAPAAPARRSIPRAAAISLAALALGIGALTGYGILNWTSRLHR
jgi:hypothetical protein